MENKRRLKTEDSKLKNIAEVTEEYNESMKRSSTIASSSAKIDKVETPRWTEKLKTCLSFILTKFYQKSKKSEFDINQSQMTKQVERIKKRKSKIEPLLPPISQQKTRTLVLDLDQTLIHTSFKRTKSYDFTAQIEIRGQLEKVYITKRFGLDIFLFEMSQLYQLVIFTAGLKEYTDKVLDLIDPKKRIQHVLYRDQCTVLNQSYFLKNLKLLGRNMKQIILIDDNSMAGLLNPEIFYKIDPYYGDSRDRKLLRLIEFFKMMAESNDFDCLLEKRRQFESKTLKPSSYLNHNINKYSIEQAKKLKIDKQPEVSENTLNKTEENTAMELVKEDQI